MIVCIIFNLFRHPLILTMCTFFVLPKCAFILISLVFISFLSNISSVLYHQDLLTYWTQWSLIKKICQSKMIVWSSATFILRWSCSACFREAVNYRCNKINWQITEHVYKKELYKHLKWKCRRRGGRFKGRRWCNIICILLLPQIVFDPREPNQTSTQISEISFSLNLSEMNEIDSWRQNCTFQSLTKYQLVWILFPPGSVVFRVLFIKCEFKQDLEKNVSL